jgi:hypothetical protein
LAIHAPVLTNFDPTDLALTDPTDLISLTDFALHVWTLCCNMTFFYQNSLMFALHITAWPA